MLLRDSPSGRPVHDRCPCTTGTSQPDRVYRHPIRVYFEDTDAGGMAYHATYLRWAERARTESLRALGLPHQQMIERHHSLLVVRRVEVEYLRPARLDAALVVETAILRVSGAQITLDQRVRREPGPGEERGEELARLTVGLVCVAEGSLRPVPIPEPWRSALRGLVLAPKPGAGTGRGAGQFRREARRPSGGG